MSCWQYLFVIFFTVFSLVSSAVILDDDVEEQGLYSKSDHVTILTGKNFNRKFYGRKYAQLVQFYNSYCGHCRAFSPKFKSFATDIKSWKNIIQLSVIDCFEEDNSEVCRNFEVMSYPTLRYVHENFVKGNGNVGERFQIADTPEKLKIQLIEKLKEEQKSNHLRQAPWLDINSYSSYTEVQEDVSSATVFLFLVFEFSNSTVGPEVILTLSDYPNVRVKRVLASSELCTQANLNKFPSVVALKRDTANVLPSNITPDDPSAQNILKSIKSYLRKQNYVSPDEDDNHSDIIPPSNDHVEPAVDQDFVYYSDLEKTLKNTLHTEITRYKSYNSEQYEALLNYLEVLKDDFPYKGNENLRAFLSELTNDVKLNNNIQGSSLYTLIKNLEAKHNPYRSNESDYIGCKGSQPIYRGFTCGLWQLFHSLTVGASTKTDQEGPKVLRAMFGYVKYFFGCTHCSEHFQEMAERNRIFDVRSNDKAVLWLWISHNEVNLRLAGDETEDPQYPKIQFPSARRCPQCRQARGAWNLPAVYQYLLTVYGSDIQVSRHYLVPAASTFSHLDIGLLSFLYILSFIILIIVIRFFLTRRLYRKRFYKHGRGKV